MLKGKILSVESMGLVDGPGIRTVIFFKGCPLRCVFCHNPDSWDASGSDEITSGELLKKILRFRPYFERSGGGVTFSGGEPLLQKDFLIEILEKCKKEGIHTCLDTSGAGIGDYEKILTLTDLVLYDVKALSNDKYNEICNAGIFETQKFTTVLRKLKTPTIVRQVVVPGINDTEDYMKQLREYITVHIPHASSVELLPYHRMGEHKYKALGLDIPLGDTPAMDKEKCSILQQKFFADYENERI